MKYIFLLFFCIFFLGTRSVVAQELDARVDLNLQALSDADRQAFGNFVHDVQAYLNDNTWTTDFTGERIKCSFQFNIMTNNGGDYTAQLFINSTRPLYKSTERTTMINVLDGNLEFTYYLGQALQHGTNFRQLESVLDFYVYIIIGLDYDSYKEQAGTLYFQQAQTVAVIANSAGGTGWQEDMTSIGTYTRVGFINDAMDANNRAFRDMMFMYHYYGLDLLSTKPDEARDGIGTAIDSLVTLKHESSAADRSVFLRAFFEAKYPELTDLSRLFPDNLSIYFQKLEFLDPTHAQYYSDALTKIQNGAGGSGN
jgi:Domain of unknown function (DUF4835)